MYNPDRKHKILIDLLIADMIDDMIADIISNKKLNQIAIKLFIRGRKHFFCFYHTILFPSTKTF